MTTISTCPTKREVFSALATIKKASVAMAENGADMSPAVLLAKVLTAQASAAYFEHRCAILLGAFKGAAIVIERAAGRLVELGDVEGAKLVEAQMVDLRKAVGAEVKARPAPANTRAAGH
jgi:hypothetical protein